MSSLATAIQDDFEIVQDNVPSTAPVSEEQKQVNLTRHLHYVEVDKVVYDTPIIPLILTYKGQQIAALFKHDITQSPNLQKLEETTKKQWNCGTCTRRAYDFGKLSGPNGQIFMPPSVLKQIQPHAHTDFEIYDTISEAAGAISSTPIVDIQIVRGELIAFNPHEAGGFVHWTLKVDEKDQTAKNMAAKTIQLLEKAFHRYLPIDLPQQILKLVGDGSKAAVQGALDSLKLMEKCIHAAPYGDKWLAAFRWIQAIVQDLKDRDIQPQQMSDVQRWSFYAQHLLNSGCINEDANDSAVCPFYHTVNGNIIDLLACAESEAAMVKLITERLSPLNYQRRDPTAQLSQNEIDIAMKELGEFKNTMMTQAESATLPYVVVLKAGADAAKGTSVSDAIESSSINGFKKLIAMTQDLKIQQEQKSSIDAVSSSSAAGSFAARTGNGSKDLEIKDITTIDALLEYLAQHPDAKMLIKSAGFTPCYVAKTTLKEDALAYKHPWLFLNGTGCSSVGIGATATVTQVIPMYKYIGGHKYRNVLFVTKEQDVKKTTILNCNLPEFLSSKYTRTCGKAFERLNTITPLIIPDGPVAIGLGACCMNEAGSLIVPVNLTIDGINVTIKKLH